MTRRATTTRRAAEPVRMCVACRRRRPQRELARLVRGPDGIRLDEAGRRPGRGAYVCPEPACADAARRGGGHAVRRALRGGTDDEVMRALDEVGVASPEEQEA